MIYDHFSAQKFVDLYRDVDDMDINEVITRIVSLNTGLRKFWSDAKGWAPVEAAELLSKSRLDWQVSLSKSLVLWVNELPKGEDATLILAWANLGSLVEGTLKLFLSAWHKSHKDEVDELKKNVKNPDKMTLGPIREFYKQTIWDSEWNEWVSHIQQRRNAIHAFRNRDIGTPVEFLNDVRRYLYLLRYINFRLPYPGDEYIPRE